MIYHATIEGRPEETISCRVFDPSLGQWLSGETWGPESEATLTQLTSVGEYRHSGPVTYPYAGVVIEYLLQGQAKPIGEDPITAAPGVDQFVIPVVTVGGGSTEFTTQKKFNVRRGDSRRIPVSLGLDCTGWTAWFGGKRSAAQSEYDMPLRQLTWQSEADGTLYIDLASTDTSETGTVYGEVELRKGAERNTPEAYTFRIVEDIVR